MECTTIYFKAVQVCLLITNNKLYTVSIKESIVKSALDTACCVSKVGSSMGSLFFLLRCENHWKKQFANLYDGNVWSLYQVRSNIPWATWVPVSSTSTGFHINGSALEPHRLLPVLWAYTMGHTAGFAVGAMETRWKAFPFLPKHHPQALEEAEVWSLGRADRDFQLSVGRPGEDSRTCWSTRSWQTRVLNAGCSARLHCAEFPLD